MGTPHGFIERGCPTLFGLDCYDRITPEAVSQRQQKGLRSYDTKVGLVLPCNDTLSDSVKNSLPEQRPSCSVGALHFQRPSRY